MAKTKTTLGSSSSKHKQHYGDAQVKTISSVKAGAVTKPSQTPKSKSKEVAKQVVAKAYKVEKEGKKSKKAKKEPTPEPSSESDSDEEISSASSASSDDDSEAEAKPAAKTDGVRVNGSAEAATAAKEDTSDSSSSSDDEPAVPKPASAQAAKKATAAKAGSDSEDSEDDSEDESEDDSEDDSEDESSEDESADIKPAAAGAIDRKALNGKLEKVASKDESSDESSEGSSESGSEEDSSEEDSEEEEAPAPKKRKAEADAEPVAKKAKTETTRDDASKRNLFVGSLSWNVDEDWLTREFESFGELSGVRVITDKATGRSKGFGYVEFVNAEDGIKAHKEMNGALMDNRALNVDFASARTEKPDRAKQFGDQKTAPSDTLFVANIAFEATEDIIGEEFGKHGDVIGVRLPTDMESGNPKGFGYVQFSSIEGAAGAMEKMTGASICGRPIRLDFSTPRTNTGDSPRGGRGGRGGFDRGGRGGGRGRGGFDRGGRGGGRGGRGGRGGSTNRGGFGDFQGKKMTF